MTKQSNFVVFLSKNNIDIIADESPNLSKLIYAGVHMPQGFLVTSKAFTHFLEENFLEKKIKDLLSTAHFERVDSLMQLSTHIKNLIIRSKMPNHLIQELIEEYKKMDGVLSNAYVAVGDENIKVKGVDKIVEKIRHIWASKFEPNYLLSYKENNISSIDLKIPIPVQKVIDSKKMGILLTSIYAIDTKSKLNGNQKREILELGKRLKEHFYFPQVVTWAIKGNKIYTTNISLVTNMQNSYLALVRHGTSEYNTKGLWAGWDNPKLTEEGKREIEKAAKTIKDINFDIGFTSPLIRHFMTLEIVKKVLKKNDMPAVISDSLLERNYGDYTGKNKWEIQKKIGKAEFLKLRRSWDYPVPNGETLKDVYNRIVPYYNENVLPQLKAGKNVLISSSGNALRTLIKYLENISDENISKLEIAPGEVYLYKIDEDGKVVGREIRNQHQNEV